MRHIVKKSETIRLGKQGEHRARELVFPEIAEWEAEYGPGETEIIFLPHGEKTPFSVTPAQAEDGAWLWSVTSKETACPGFGKCELRYTIGGVVVKSVTYQTHVAESFGEDVTVPETSLDGTQQTGETQTTTGEGAPGEDTPAVVGQHYFDTESGKEYVCTGVSEDGKTSWRQAGAADASELTYNGGNLSDYLDRLAKDVAGSKPLTGPEDPDSSTKGAVGQHYLNTETGKEYTCAAADDEAGVYTWKESGSGGGSVITITFDAEFAGREYTVSDGSDTVTGIVPEELTASVNVLNIDSTYTITAEADGVRCSTGVTVGPYFGRYTAVLKYSKIYGVRWSGGPETMMSRTDGAEGFLEPDPFVNDGVHPGWSPFDTLMPWAGMRIVDDPVLGKLVSIPKYWYRWTKNGAAMTLQISDKKQDGFLVSPAHADRGDGQGERDVVYVGRYHCGATVYRSASGQSPKANITRAAARTAIHALDAAAWQYDFAMYWTIRMLYLVEFADWNSQKVIGWGCGKPANGATDTMGYHTGTTQISRNAGGGGCQYRWIEGLWDAYTDFVDGIYFYGESVYCINNPASFSDTASGILTGVRPAITGNIIEWGVPTVDGFEWALYPSKTEDSGGIYTTYVTDAAYYAGSNSILVSGAGGDNHAAYGIFCLFGCYAPSATNEAYVCRLMKLPNKEDE